MYNLDAQLIYYLKRFFLHEYFFSKIKNQIFLMQNNHYLQLTAIQCRKKLKIAMHLKEV